MIRAHRGAHGLRLALPIFLLGGLLGCRSLPQTVVSSPLVYTTRDLAAHSGNTSETLPRDLRRYFRSKPDVYEKDKERIDLMLDDPQRDASYFQASAAATGLGLTYASLDALSMVAIDERKETAVKDGQATTTTLEVKPPARLPDGYLDAFKLDGKRAPRVSNNLAIARINDLFTSTSQALISNLDKIKPSDSPFDRLDRSTDLFTAYHLKTLKLKVDGRTLRHDGTGSIPAWRYVLLAFEANVDVGKNPPNTMTGVRIRVKEGRGFAIRNDGSLDVNRALIFPPERIEIVRLHPKRSYDLEDVNYAGSSESRFVFSLNALLPISGGVGKVEGDRDAYLRALAVRNFVSRVSKTTSYADAGSKTFGWDFYPSNLIVSERSKLSRAASFIFGTPEKFRVQGFLEPGGRDTFAYVVVPTGVTEIVCDVTSVRRSLGRGLMQALNVRSYDHESDPEEFIISLPPYDPAEAGAVEEVPLEMPAE